MNCPALPSCKTSAIYDIIIWRTISNLYTWKAEQRLIRPYNSLSRKPIAICGVLFSPCRAHNKSHIYTTTQWPFSFHNFYILVYCYNYLLIYIYMVVGRGRCCERCCEILYVGYRDSSIERIVGNSERSLANCEKKNRTSRK